MQSRVRGEESPTFIHSSRGSGCACVCRPCINNAQPMAIVIATPDVRNARLFISLSVVGYPIQMHRKGRVAKDPTVAPAPSNYRQFILSPVRFLSHPMRTMALHAEPAKRKPGARMTYGMPSLDGGYPAEQRLCFFCSRGRSRWEQLSQRISRLAG